MNFHRMSLAAVKVNLEDAFNITAVQYSNLSSAYFYAYAAMQIPAGILADVWGTRKTVFAGMLLMGISSVIYGLGPSYTVLFVARLFVGVGASVVFLSILKMQTLWFDESEFGTLTGITACISNIGGAISQAPLALMVAVLTWQMTFVSIGIFTVLMGIISFIVIRDRPEDKGWEPIVPESKNTDKVKIGEGLREIFKNKYIYSPLIIDMFANGLFVCTITWALAYLTDVYGLSTTKAGSITFFIPIGAAVGALSCGKLSDKWRNRKIINIIMSCGSLICFSAIALGNHGKLPLAATAFFLILIGMFELMYAVNYGIAKDLNDTKYSGISTSILNTGAFVGASIFPILFGSIIGKFEAAAGAQYAFQKGFILLAICSLIMLIVSMTLIETNCKNRYYEIKAGTFNKSIFKIK